MSVWWVLAIFAGAGLVACVFSWLVSREAPPEDLWLDEEEWDY